MKKKISQDKLWGNAFSVAPDDKMLQFTVGHDAYGIEPADQMLLKYDIQCNLAQAKMLLAQKLLTENEFNKLETGLLELSQLVAQGKFILNPALEDMHSNIENWLTEKYGIEIGGKIHTGRSRNDQVVTDLFLFVHDQLNFFQKTISTLNQAVLEQAKKYQNTVCPGYTHHQHAVVTSFGYILHAFYVSFKRDLLGLKQLQEKFDYSPLGASVGYGTLIPIDPEKSAEQLGFSKPFANAIDVITNRGELEAEFAFQLVKFLNHCSTLAESLILFSMPEFGFIKLADQYSTGSSAMPQKKNPDPLELIKGKSKSALGYLFTLLNLTNSALIGYNRDTQESKYAIYHLVNNVKLIPEILQGVVSTLTVNKVAMKVQANSAFINSMGLMELIMLQSKLPMRQVKQIIEKAIKASVAKGEQNKVLYAEFIKIVKSDNLAIKISKQEFAQFQDANFQLKILQKQFNF
ncbi:MAG: argininosuccinate lyase [bacterium]